MTFKNKVLRISLLSGALLALAAVSPASAQYAHWDAPPPPPSYGGRIHPQQIEEMVRSMGFQPVAEPRPRGPLWVTHAVDRGGQQVRVLIDGYSGRVIDVLRRPLPPQNVAAVPPPNFPQSDARVPNVYPPYANAPAPQSDYEDDGPDYDYRPQNRPQDWPPSRPNVQPQQGPNVIPYEPRSDNNRLPNAPKTNTAKKKEKKNDNTAALTPDKQKTPSPKSRPEDAPKANATKNEKNDAPKAETPKPDVPKTAQTPKMPAADNVRSPDPNPTGATKPEVPTFDAPKNRPSTVPPVQPPF